MIPESLILALAPYIDGLRTTWLWPGLAEVGQFLGTHLISGMVPAFFIAGAIAVFLDKQRITQLMGPKANPWLAYPVAALSGGILTVCSCGTIPIFAGILTQGAGTGPAFTFLFATPAINLIALVYTVTYMGSGVMMARAIGVIVVAIVIGFSMRLWFPDPETERIEGPEMVPEDSTRTSGQTLVFFLWLVLIMLTSTGVLDRLMVQGATRVGLVSLQTAETVSQTGTLSPAAMTDLSPASATVLAPGTGSPLVLPFLAKLIALACELVALCIMLKLWFPRDEIIIWLKKAWSLFLSIFPKILLGLFISGALAALLPMVSFMSYFRENTIGSNLLVSFIGALSYFGTIVGVNIVATMNHFGMHLGPCLALLLAGPAVSLPSVLALVPIVGARKSAAYLFLVVVCSAATGYYYGTLQ